MTDGYVRQEDFLLQHNRRTGDFVLSLVRMQVLRTRFAKDIVAEFLPSVRPSQDVVILCDGMPGVPSKSSTHRLMEFLSRKGFWVFNPRYRGTWESGGTFLDHDPTQDILDVITDLSEQKSVRSIWDDAVHPINPKRFYVIGVSFGGAAAILSTLDSRVVKAIAIAPVVDWKVEEASHEEPMSWLGPKVAEAFGNGYRFTKEEWDRLSRGELYNPVSHLKNLDGKKFMIVHAEDDGVVLPGPVIAFATSAGCPFFLLKKGGHLPRAIIMQWRMWRKVKKFFDE